MSLTKRQKDQEIQRIQIYAREEAIVFRPTELSNGCCRIYRECSMAGTARRTTGEEKPAPIKTLPESVNRVLVVGHNPVLIDLVYDLTSLPKFIPMNPATLVALTLEGCEWSGLGPGKCRFAWAV